jgi:hypothetical protein
MLGRDGSNPVAPFYLSKQADPEMTFEIPDQNPNRLTPLGSGPRRVSTIRSPPFVAELP